MNKVSSPLVQRLLGLSHRFAYALVLSLSIWVFAGWPGAHLSTTLMVVAKIVTAPLYFSGRVLPMWIAGGIDVGWETGEHGLVTLYDLFWRHLRHAVPLFTILFYVPEAVALLLVWRRKATHSRPTGP